MENETQARSTTVRAEDRPAGELVKDLSEQISRLVRDELRLAQVEMTRKGKQAGLGVGMFAGGGIFAWFGLACLIACAVIAIAGVVAAWLAALIVGSRAAAGGGHRRAGRAGSAEAGDAACSGRNHRQREGRCRGTEGKGTPMTAGQENTSRLRMRSSWRPRVRGRTSTRIS